MVAREASGEQPLLLAALPPTTQQRRLAFVIIGIFVVAFGITVPFANTPLPRVNGWLPAFTATLTINDLITSVLLFSQFSIARQRTFLVLALGYLFSALIIIPYALTFPGIFAPTGLLGADLQTAVWFYIVWHVASPSSVILYALTKVAGDLPTPRQSSPKFVIGLSVVFIMGFVGALVWLFTAHHDLLPIIYLDNRSLAPLANVAAGLIFLLSATAIVLLWVRGESVLDLWLAVTACAWLLEITLNGLLLTDRFSLAWYIGRIFALISGSVVLIVLLSEATTLYAHLARSMIRQRAARQTRQIAMDAMAASIAHEVNQPLGAIAANTDAALLYLARTPPNNDQVRAALEDIAAATARGAQVITTLRAMFKKGAHKKVLVDVNDLIREALATLDVDLRAQRVYVSTRLDDSLPPVSADRIQMQQVFLNLIMNGVEAMNSVVDRSRRLRIASEFNQADSNVSITIKDSGTGLRGEDKDRIFEPFFTTKSTGTGIGLTICRSIIDSHGGSLRVTSGDPQGTVFEVVLPIES